MTSCAACFFQVPASVTHLELLALGVGRWALVFAVGSCRLLHTFVLLLHPWQRHVSNFLSFLSKSALLVPSLFSRSSRRPAFPDRFGVSSSLACRVSPRCGLRRRVSLIFSSADMTLPHWLPSSTSASAS